MTPEHDVRVGQVRTWRFDGDRNPNLNGKSFLVLDVDGIRADVMNSFVESCSSYYVVWLANHSEIAYEEG
jgi:hypothetical protein